MVKLTEDDRAAKLNKRDDPSMGDLRAIAYRGAFSLGSRS
jgi:hypothetical protein